MSFLGRLFTDDPVKGLTSPAKTINYLEEDFSSKTQQELRDLTTQWQGAIKQLPLREDFWSPDKERKQKSRDELSAYLLSILPQAFAAVREAAKRTLKQRHFDVQLMGGMVLHQGKIAEMKTGEGKTLSSTLPVYLNALTGLGVHVVTVNDYLSRRDASWMGQIYDYLGLSVGVIQHAVSYKYQQGAGEVNEEAELIEEEAVKVQLDVRNLAECSRREAYHCDITYGTNNEFGFDYLRDNMVGTLEQKVQRRHAYAIVDEVDSILIDEARTPLIISAPDTDSTDKYYEFSRLVDKLSENEDYNVDLKKKSATLTEGGIARLEKLLGVDNIYVEKGIITVHHIEQALRAKTLFKKDRDYVVRENEIVIVDEFTGRMLPGRRYSEGLHQAIEAKEGVAVQKESKTLATITFQNYFRLYAKLAGMTGTAKTEEEEFQKIYGLDVVVIPTNKPVVRKDFSDSVYKSEQGKFLALVKDIKECHQKGQPVLIGTVSIEKNEMISDVLSKAGVPHELLNAKNHENEAKIIAQAGRLKAVTLATNIAGRGVDIILGGTPFDEGEAAKVRALGGLKVIGTERHESRRIDNQLRGRSGRQGDPGSTQFFISLEDELIRLFGGQKVQQMMESLGIPEDMPIQNPLVSRVIEQAQKKIEGLNFDVRKHVLEFDDVMNKQREVIYRIRDRVLEPEADLKEDILEKIELEIENTVSMHTADADKRQWNVKEVFETANSIFPLPQGISREAGNPSDLIERLKEAAISAYDQKEKQLSPEVMRQIEKAVILRNIDTLWMEHLDTMDHLRQSVRLRGYAQKDPLIEYKREGFSLFENLLYEIDKGIVYTIYKVELRTQPQSAVPKNILATHSTGLPQSSGKSPDDKKIGRNDPCWCGSGKKFKKCHGK